MKINIGSFEFESTGERMSWRDAGGCEAATARIGGDWRTAEALLGLLGEGAEIHGEAGGPRWWGYLNGIEVCLYGCKIIWSLDGLANRTQVEYIQMDGALAGGGYQWQTVWTDDLVSQQRYGVKEMRFSEGWSSLALAQGVRDRELAKRRLPVPGLYPAPDVGGGIILHLKGWWQKLDWKFHYQDAGRVVYDDLGIGKQNLGRVAGDTMVAQQFTVPAGGWRFEQAAVYIRKVGAPSDVLLFDIYTDTAGAPGTLLCTATMAGSGLSTDYRWESGYFGINPVSLTAGVYWLVLRRSGATSTSNYYRVRVNEIRGYTGGVLRLWNGSAWVARSGVDADLNFRVWGLAEVASQVAGAVSYAGSLGISQILSTTGEYCNPYRDGSITCLENANHLLRMAALRAEVMPTKRVLISTRPAGTPGLTMGEDGQLRTLAGALVAPGSPVAGELVTVNGWAWGAAGDKGIAYIWRAEWSAGVWFLEMENA